MAAGKTADLHLLIPDPCGPAGVPGCACANRAQSRSVSLSIVICRKVCMLAGTGLLAAQVWAAADVARPAPMVAPPPPRMLDSATSTVESPDGTLSVPQRQRCQSLLDQINALPVGEQWSTGKPSVTTADGRTYPTLERQADRKRLEEAYRQECTQQSR
uniref:Uncharacterized protein n=2 Tax=Burkholderiaceae TaxID=119060 RepID=Q46V54_CUPPJ